MGEFTLLVAFNADNHRLQNAPFATVDRHYGTARGCGEHHAGIFFVLKECLAFDNAIAFLYPH